MEVIMLGPQDVERIVELEKRAFVPSLQGTAATFRRRFELGHLMFGLLEGGRLIGMQAVSYGRFEPDDPSLFPASETAYGLQSVPPDYNAVYSYNFEIDPDFRGASSSEQLFYAIMDRAQADGCTYAVACARIPSYAGSEPGNPQESFSAGPIRRAIDRHLAGGPYPSLEEMLQDPLLAFYYKLGRRARSLFHWILRDYAPHDVASGGHRVVLYSRLHDWVATNVPVRNQMPAGA